MREPTPPGPSDLRAHLVDLLAPHGPGDPIVLGARFVHASTELGLRLTFELGGRIVHVEVAPAEDERRFAVRTERLALSYRAASETGAGIARDEGAALCRALAPLIASNEDRVLAAIARDAAAARESREGSTRVREVEVSSLLEPGEWQGTRYYTISPYVGCLIGCRFCYAQSRVALLRRLEGIDELAWGSYVDARANAAEVLARELDAHPIAPIKFCPVVSDPYHAIEQRLEITRACLEAIRGARKTFPTMVLTRARLIERDAALLGAIPIAYAGVSIPTIDDEVRRHFEPRGAPIADRFAALATLRAHGVRTFAVVQPMLPGAIDALADSVAAHADSASLDVLSSIERAEDDFADPRFAAAKDGGWQRERASALEDALAARGVVVWRGELPPELLAPAAGSP